MKSWSLKVKIGAYAALLTMVALGLTALAIMPLVRYQQLQQLDSRLAGGAAELHRNILNFRQTDPMPNKRVPARIVPVGLRDCYVVVEDSVGFNFYRSPNLSDAKMPAGDPGLRNVQLLGGNCRLGTYREGKYVIRIGASLAQIEEFQGTLMRSFLGALPVAGLVVFFGGIWLGRKAVAPVSDLTEAAERISAQRPDERLPLPAAKDEIARLTEVLNDSFDRMQRSYEAARRFSADASHQLKTPVSVLRVGLGELRDSPSLGEAEKQEVQSLLQQTRRLSGLIEDLLLLAQVDAGRLKLDAGELDLSALADAAMDDLGVLAASRAIKVESRVPPELSAVGDRRQVSLVLQNLIENAAKYTPEQGSIRLEAGQENGMAWLRVGNSGGGIPEMEQTRLFERFYRGSEVGEGVRGQGLGLNIARELARAQEGDLVLRCSDSGWTEFEFSLPASG